MVHKPHLAWVRKKNPANDLYLTVVCQTAVGSMSAYVIVARNEWR